jgi:Leucine-rich repeat (LRR) protein
LETLTGLAALQELSLDATSVTGLGFRHLTELPKLRTLHADHGQLTDDSLAHLGKIPTLQQLHLGSNKGLSDKGLLHLHGLAGLQILSLRATAVTKAGIQTFKSKVPACQVFWDGE